MRKGIFSILIFLSLAAFAQPPVISIVSARDTIDALNKNIRQPLRVLRIQFQINTRLPVTTAVNVAIVNYGNISSRPLLNNATLNIEASSFTPTDNRLLWNAFAVCVLTLRDTSLQDEFFYLVKAGDISSALTVLVHPNARDTLPASNPVSNDPGKTSAHVQLDNSVSFINPVYTKDSIRYEKIIMRLKRDVAPNAGNIDSVFYTIENHSAQMPLKFISSSKMLIKSADWKTDDSKNYYYTDTVIVENKTMEDTLKRDLSCYIRIGNDNSFHEINITERGMTKDQPFWMETGSNFDLLDGVKANNLYAGIYMFEKDIGRIGGRKNHNNLSFTGGVYESKSSSFATSSDSGLIYRDGTSYLPQYDPSTQTNHYRYYRDTGSVTTTTNVQSIGVFFSPHLRLTSMPLRESGLHVFFSVYLEMLWQRVNSNFDYSKTGRDSVLRENNLDDIYKHNFKEKSLSSDFRTQYIGLGLPFYINHSSFSLYINDVFGMCNQKFAAVSDTGLLTKRSYLQQKNGTEKNSLMNTYEFPKHAWNPFYLLQFRLTEETYGLVFTGEVRGFFLQNSKPVISLSLSKKFNLGELLKAIVKPFSPGT